MKATRSNDSEERERERRKEGLRAQREDPGQDRLEREEKSSSGSQRKFVVGKVAVSEPV